MAASSASASAPPHSLLLAAVALAALASVAAARDENGVYDPCSDSRIQRGDGFSFGIAFASLGAFYSGGSVQLSPCDRRLSLASSGQLAVFRPKVDEISLLTINTTTGFNPLGLLMVLNPSRLQPNPLQQFTVA
uniref:Legume lectin domain-containing protein n=1 Tax=Oryza punctata TaxID=4537 RepID=A0A0E0KGV1_ORYPU